jgi:hypothetical protein
MRGDRNPSLTVDVINLLDNSLAEVDHAVDADGNDMMFLVENLLSREDEGTPNETSEPSADASVGQLIVAGDRERIESLTLSLEDEAPRCQPSVAPRRAVSVKIDGEHAVTVEHQYTTRLGAVESSPSRDRDGQECRCCDAAGRHGATQRGSTA